MSSEVQYKIYSDAYDSSLDKIADGTVDKALLEVNLLILNTQLNVVIVFKSYLYFHCFLCFYIQLNDLVHCSECVTEGGLSLDDIDFWSRVRSLTLVKGIKWPEKLLSYMKNLSAKGDVPLYFSMAC